MRAVLEWAQRVWAAVCGKNAGAPTAAVRWVERMPMEDEEILRALTVLPQHPVYRAMMTVILRHGDMARAEIGAERNAARNPMKTAYYAGQLGGYDALAQYLEELRQRGMAMQKGGLL